MPNEMNHRLCLVVTSRAISSDVGIHVLQLFVKPCVQ